MKKFFRSLLSIAIIVTIIYSVLALRPYEVSGDSMYPTLIDRHLVIVDQIRTKAQGILRGDIIVYTSPEGLRIKRVIGLPDETLTIADGQITLHSIPLIEPYLPSGYKTCVPGSCLKHETKEYMVPEGSFFVLGDHRENSYDSRGCRDQIECADPEPFFVKAEDIVGTVFFQIPWVQLPEHNT